MYLCSCCSSRGQFNNQFGTRASTFALSFSCQHSADTDLSEHTLSVQLEVYSVSACWRLELGQDTPGNYLASAGQPVADYYTADADWQKVHCYAACMCGTHLPVVWPQTQWGRSYVPRHQCQVVDSYCSPSAPASSCSALGERESACHSEAFHGTAAAAAHHCHVCASCCGVL